MATNSGTPMRPKPKSLPAFPSLDDEAKFWLAADPDEDEGKWEEVPRSPKGRSVRVGGVRSKKAAGTATGGYDELVTIVLDAVLERLKGTRDVRLASATRRQIVRDVVKATRVRPRGPGRARSAAR